MRLAIALLFLGSPLLHALRPGFAPRASSCCAPRARATVALASKKQSRGPVPEIPQLAPKQALGYTWSLICLPVAFSVYLSTDDLLNRLLVDDFDFSRGASDAFSPFITLLGLIYSILLQQIYGYLLERQRSIEEALFQEISALELLSESIDLCAQSDDALRSRRVEFRAILHEEATKLLQYGLTTQPANLQTRCRGRMLRLVDTVDCAMLESNGGQSAVMGIASGALTSITQARSKRIAAIAGELPVIKTVAQRVVRAFVLLGFVLVDLGAPKLEALLFAVIAASFTLINILIDDLGDPFGGSWNVDPARDDLETLVEFLDPQNFNAAEELKRESLSPVLGKR